MIGNRVQATCKKCNRQAPADEFTLDPIYRMMVCPQCVRDRKTGQVQKERQEQRPVSSVAQTRPPGWEPDEDLLAKQYAQKQKERQANQQRFTRISADKIEYTCTECNHSFPYNIVKKSPRLCVFCGERVPDLRL